MTSSTSKPTTSPPATPNPPPTPALFDKPPLDARPAIQRVVASEGASRLSAGSPAEGNPCEVKFATTAEIDIAANSADQL